MDGRLFEVAIEGNNEMLLKLLEEDPPMLDRVMSECKGKDNPLHVGALYGNVEFVEEILKRKKEFTCALNSQGQSPLHLASARGHVKVVEVILRADPDACLICDQDGMIPLHLAAIKGRVQVLETLLVEAKKMTPFILTKSGEPILHLCANNNQFKALEKLVEFVTDRDFVNLKDSDDNTILHLLAAKGNSKNYMFKALQKLVELVADDNFVNLKDSDDNNILHVLSSKNQSELIKLLVQNGTVDVNAVNIHGSMPLDVSIGISRVLHEGWDTDFILIDAGAKRSVPISRIGQNWMIGSWFNEAVLVVAILMVTVAFQAGINPPGGVWQDTGYHNVTLPNAPQSSPPKLVHHYAGQSVMSHVDPKRYREFSFLNDYTLLSSILVIVLLLKDCFVKSPFYKVLAILFTFTSVCTMWAAYVVSSPYISSLSNSLRFLVALILSISMVIVAIIIPPNFHVVWYETLGLAPGHPRTTSVQARAVGRP